MAQFVIDTIEGSWTKFKCEYKASPDQMRQVIYVTMFKHVWEKAGRPTELLVTIEGLVI